MDPDDRIMRGPGERRVAEAAERIVAEGRPRLHRTWTSLVATVVAGAATWLDLLRMWGTVLVMNLIGGWAFMWLVMQAFPELHGTAAASGATFADGGYTLGTFCLAVLGNVVGGFLLTTSLRLIRSAPVLSDDSS
ncbi:hypothetical protein ABZ733_16575 [Streptomyces longwoodensis]|uniref:hypothetical protein n=1 Tax=Streptomyces longwoodensis TaxID=68231 RepID=UPI0033E117EF